MTNDDQLKAIAKFWQVFQQHSDELACVSSAEDPVYDVILVQLQKVQPKLFFEFSSEAGNSELIITADGDASLFALVDLIVQSAPEIPGWRVIPLKPKLGFPIQTTWNGFTVTISDVVFEPMERKDSNELGLCMFLHNLSPDDIDDAHNALLRALDHGLGERNFAESVQHTEVHPLTDGRSSADYIPLSKLEEYINWRRKRGQGNLK